MTKSNFLNKKWQIHNGNTKKNLNKINRHLRVQNSASLERDHMFNIQPSIVSDVQQLKRSRATKNDILIQDSDIKIQENTATVTYHSID